MIGSVAQTLSINLRCGRSLVIQVRQTDDGLRLPNTSSVQSKCQDERLVSWFVSVYLKLHLSVVQIIFRIRSALFIVATSCCCCYLRT